MPSRDERIQRLTPLIQERLKLLQKSGDTRRYKGLQDVFKRMQNVGDVNDTAISDWERYLSPDTFSQENPNYKRPEGYPESIEEPWTFPSGKEEKPEYPLPGTGEAVNPSTGEPMDTSFISPESPLQSPVTVEDITPDTQVEQYKPGELDVSEQGLKLSQLGAVGRVGDQAWVDWAEVLRNTYKDSKLVNNLIGFRGGPTSEILNDFANMLVAESAKFNAIKEERKVEGAKEQLEGLFPALSAGAKVIGAELATPNVEGGRAEMTTATDEEKAKVLAEKQAFVDEAKKTYWQYLPTGIKMINQGVKTAIQTFFTGIQWTAKSFERALGTGTLELEALLSKEKLSYQDAYYLSRLTYSLSVTKDMERMAGVLGVQGKIEQAKKEHASTMEYRGVAYDILKNELLRRYHSGESPELLAKMAENPLIEAIGQSLADPLQGIDFYFAATKIAKGVAKAGEVYGLAPELDKLAGAVRGIGRETAGTTALSDLDNAIQVSYGATIRGEVGLSRETRASKLFVMRDSTSNIQHLTNITSNIINPIIKGADKEALVGRITNWITALAGKNEIVRRTALAQLVGDDAFNVMMSPNGQRVGKYLADFLVDSKGRVGLGKIGKILEEAKKAKDPVSTLLDLTKDIVAGQAGRQFVNMQTRIASADKLKEIIAAGGEIPEKLKPYLINGRPEEIGQGIRFLSGLEKSKAIQGVNTVQGAYNTIYLNTFAFGSRNVQNNVVTQVFDDPRSLFFYGGKRRRLVEQEIGLSSLAKQGIGGSRGLESVRGKKKWVDSILHFGPNISNFGEKLTGASLAISATDAAMLKMEKAIVYSVKDDLKRAGWTEDMIRQFKVALNETHNLDKAIENVLGALPVPNLTDDGVKLLNKHGQLDWFISAYRESLTAPDPMAKLQEFCNAHLDEIRKVGNTHLSDYVLLEKNQLGGILNEDTGTIGKLAEAGTMPQVYVDRIATQNAALHNAKDMFDQEFMRLAYSEMTEIEGMVTRGEITLEDAMAAGWTKGWKTDLPEKLKPMKRVLEAMRKELDALCADYWSRSETAIEKFGNADSVWGKDSVIYRDARSKLYYKYQHQILQLQQKVANEINSTVLALNPKSSFPNAYDEYTDLSRIANDWELVDPDWYKLSHEGIIIEGEGVAPAVEIQNLMGAWTEMADNGGSINAVEKALEKVATTDQVVAFREARANQNIPHMKAVVYDVFHNSLGQGVRIADLPMNTDTAPSMARLIHETADGFQGSLDNLVHGLSYESTLSVEDINKAQTAMDLTRQRMTEAKAIALGYGDEARKFSLHDYGDRRGFDAILHPIFPYEFWYGRTYKNWMTRAWQNPYKVANYARYHNYLERKHAGMPDYMKWGLNTNELPGIDTKEPLWMFPEATLNPMYQLLAPEYNDPRMQRDLFTSTVEAMEQFGPSLFSGLGTASAIYYMIRGSITDNPADIDTARALQGRLVPLTSLTQGATSLMGVNNGRGLQLDPSLALQGGTDIYQEAGVSTKLTEYAANGTPIPGIGVITMEQAIDASNADRRGITPGAQDIWEAGIGIYLNDKNKPLYQRKAFSMVTAGTIGQSAKFRGTQDILISQAMKELDAFNQRSPNMEPLKVQEFYADFYDRYPFMETYFLVRKSGPERDKSMTYNVFGRVPPGTLYKWAEVVGMDTRYIGKFYDDKGDMSKWTPQERTQFLENVYSLSLVFSVPPTTLKHEWNNVRLRNTEILNEQKRLYGANILTLIDEFYSLKNDNLERTFLEKHPEVADAMNWKLDIVQQDPLMSKYYGGLTEYEDWLRSIMERRAEDQFNSKCPEGYNIRTLYYAYNELQGEDRTRFLNNYPVVGEYNIWREEELNKIGIAIENAADLFPEAPSGIIRPDYQYVTMGAADLQQQVEANMSQEEIRAEALIRANELQSDTAGDFQLTQYVRVESEKQWAGVMNKVEEYYRLKKINPTDALSYYNAPGQLDLRAQQTFERKVEDAYYGARGQTEQGTGNIINFVDIMGNELFRVVEDYIVQGKDIPERQQKKLEKIASQYGMTVDQLIEMFMR